METVICRKLKWCARQDSNLNRVAINPITPAPGIARILAEGARILAVHVLAHPDFTISDAHVRLQKVDETEWISIRSGNHVLMSKIIEGNYPNYRQVIPHHAPDLGTTLCLNDELSPRFCRHPSGRFCVLMPVRVTIAKAAVVQAEAAPAPAAPTSLAA